MFCEQNEISWCGWTGEELELGGEEGDQSDHHGGPRYWATPALPRYLTTRGCGYHSNVAALWRALSRFVSAETYCDLTMAVRYCSR